jgi:hypothetical protein
MGESAARAPRNEIFCSHFVLYRKCILVHKSTAQPRLLAPGSLTDTWVGAHLVDSGKSILGFSFRSSILGPSWQVFLLCQVQP